MYNLDKKVIGFLKEHHVLTIAASVENRPWCANCFYAYMEKENMLVFTSDHTTKHAQNFAINTNVAGSVVLETEMIGKIQGIQFSGIISLPEGELLTKAKKRYLKRFPFAIVMNTTFWTVELSYIKMTDNRLGFGKKLIWDKASYETKIL
jgi:uncharacterized protein YhbP (UPF0306 family)